MARLTTHVLDTANGVPARGVAIELRRLEGDGRQSLVVSSVTDQDGRTAPLLQGDRIEPGTYELTFHIGAYFTHLGTVVADPPFLGDVIVRFGIADATGHYHVPLLVSPYGYSTYRGC